MRALAVTSVAGVLCMSGTGARAADDYPWAWQGQCPILPQAPIEEATPSPTSPPAAPGQDAAGPVEPPAPPPPVLDPVSGHLYDPRGPRPTCARRVWAIDGSIGDRWGFVLRNCTSFVAWRLAERNAMAGFANHFRGERWGDARNWDDVARRLGYRVDSVPAIGAVAQTGAGRAGHVAWVTDIGPGTVTVEEYNLATPGGYGIRTVPVGEFGYLHLDDISPSPFVGSDRALVSVPDGLGESWTARVDDAGTLRVSHPGRPERVVGPRGSFSPVAAPALVVDGHGRPWVAATTRTGRVLAGALRGRRFALRPVGSSAATASPALAGTGTGRPVLATVSPTGTLTTLRLTRRGRWDRAARAGEPGSWATHAAPVLARRGNRTWLVAVRRDGATFTRRLGGGRLVRVPGATSSVTSTPALTEAADSTTWLHQVTAAGRLLARPLRGGRWGRASAVPGDWSPYASPAVARIGDRLHVAGVRVDGSVLVRAAVPGQRSAYASTVRSGGDPTVSPALVTRRNAGVFVVAGDRERPARVRLLTRPAWAVTSASSPIRAGFTP